MTGFMIRIIGIGHIAMVTHITVQVVIDAIMVMVIAIHHRDRV